MNDLNSLFEPIAAESVVDLVANQIENLIVQGILPEGARLPSERELSEKFDVSRPKVRDALKRLEELGLLHVRHGEGTFVAQLSGQAMTPALIDLYARHGMAFYDYLEYRKEQEAFATRLAAERSTPSDKAAIAEIIEELKQAHEAGDLDTSEQADVRLHTAIVNASHNAMLIHMMRSIYDLTQRGVFYNRRYLRTVDGSGDSLLQQHIRIADAVMSGDPGEAEAAARDHLDFVEMSFRIGEERERREAFAKKRKLALETTAASPGQANGRPSK
ncbi:FadR/GntR family transcriptional regulator [Roseibium porphyridii]|uniref:FadR/GntR family transcriptional regulator n=1 Tax=Roseibium porphyridii TaxID=2866279 RepID=A0ABY8F816_9HYPH|nr:MULTISPECIES: FadR/GntR family transcriptional regulator [Stappiaceae]QFT29299.1 Pyruvate dehydrogenase complex repressor [Labrenzia sp. THAF82]WFE90287.1 FadR/GntR family transcriptional regulator [Roseibium sp. KMA01]